MTVYKSDAVKAGIMPDYSRAGVVLCRTGRYTTADDNMVCGDTLEMVPIPKNAQIINIEIIAGPAGLALAGATGCHVGDGSSTSRFFDDLSLGNERWLSMKDLTAGTPLGKVVASMYSYTGNDTIDIKFNKAATKVPTASVFTMNVFYKMAGSVGDESF